MPVSVHNIAFKGYAGVGFVLLMLASIFYILAFGSVSWAVNDTLAAVDGRLGIWQACACSDIENAEGKRSIMHVPVAA